MALTDDERKRVFEEEKIRRQMQGKNVVVSVILSFLIPGLGDMYCGSWIKGVIFLSLDLLSFILMFAMGIGIFLYVPVWFAGLISAWLSAKKSETKAIKRVEVELT
jgi:TM2 domain-containing membrane protein YozV